MAREVNKFGYISASRTNMLEKCRYQFYQSVILNGHDQYSGDEDEKEEETLVTDDSIYLVFGKIMHKTIELFWLSEEKRTRRLLESLFRKCYKDFGLVDLSYYCLGMEMVTTYFSYLMKKAPKRQLIATEQFFDFLLLGEEYYLKMDINDLLAMAKEYGVVVPKGSSKEKVLSLLSDAGILPRAKGTIDAIFYLGNGVYEIVDYKTSNWLPPQDEVDANLQMSLYDIAFMEAKDLRGLWVDGKKPKAIILSMHYLRFDEGVVQTEMNDNQRQLNKKFFYDTYLQMLLFSEKDFYPELNTFCSYCDVCEDCPAYQEVLDGSEEADENFINEVTPEVFAELTKKSNLLKSRIKILDSALSEINEQSKTCFRKKHKDGSVIVGDIEYYSTNYTKRYLLPVVTINILKKHGLWDEKEFIKDIPLYMVEKICEENPAVWDIIKTKALKLHIGAPMIKHRKVPKSQLKK